MLNGYNESGKLRENACNRDTSSSIGINTLLIIGYSKKMPFKTFLNILSLCCFYINLEVQCELMTI